MNVPLDCQLPHPGVGHGETRGALHPGVPLTGGVLGVLPGDLVVDVLVKGHVTLELRLVGPYLVVEGPKDDFPYQVVLETAASQ